MRRGLAIMQALLLASCAAPRFRAQPIVWQVDDARDIPEPEARPFLRYAYFGDVLLMRRATRALSLPSGRQAGNTNALDEVPDSTWFTNRIGRRALAPSEVTRGPDVNGPPAKPLTVVAGKSGGGNPGFVVRDARGLRFLVKFDTHENFEMQTATSVIVNRALWAAGYNVPVDHVFDFAPRELRLAADATVEDELGRDEPMTAADLDRILALAPRRADGRVRASSSELLGGVAKGGFSIEGTRADDPNDRVPHEDRRELRGLRVLAAWLNHTDMKEDNTLDVYVEEGGRRFLRHYLVDFGEALGSHQAEKRRYEDGWEHVWDWQNNVLALFALGLWQRPWEEHRETPWPAVGAFAAEPFEPELWREAYPYFPFMEAQAEDLFWGAKLVMRFERETIAALVAAGELGSPAAAAHLEEALWRRRESIGRTWMEALSPLDELSVASGRLCAVDLGVRHGLATEGVLERLPADYWPDEDDRHRPHTVESQRVASDGRVCLPARGKGEYTVDRLRIRRGREVKPVMQVHYQAGTAPRILGVIRREP